MKDRYYKAIPASSSCVRVIIFSQCGNYIYFFLKRHCYNGFYHEFANIDPSDKNCAAALGVDNIVLGSYPI